MKNDSLRILFATAEIAPWVKTGGLGDVAGALPPALAQMGMEVSVLVPAYPAIIRAYPNQTFVAHMPSPGGNLHSGDIWMVEREDGVRMYLLHCSPYFTRPGGPYQDASGADWPDNAQRFALLSYAAAWLASDAGPLEHPPQVLHCNDWQTGLAPAYRRYLLGGNGAPTVMTIHNLAYQGVFAPDILGAIALPNHAFAWDGVEYFGNISYLKAGLQLSEQLTTVSPTYAREVQSHELGYGLDGLLRFRANDLTGILNGIDKKVWDPARDPLLARKYNARSLDLKAENKLALQQKFELMPEPSSPLVGCVSRLTHQKGLDLLLAVADTVVGEGAQFAVLGTGDPWLQDAFRDLANRHPGRVGVYIGYDEALAHQIEAGADIFAMPSRFEPCGLNQMYSLRYGTLPLVRATGGLADTVRNLPAGAAEAGDANGFSFRDATSEALLGALRRALGVWRNRALWREMQLNGMKLDFGWRTSARQYLALYQTLLLAGEGGKGAKKRRRRGDQSAPSPEPTNESALR